MEIREARPEEYAEVGRVTQAAWREHARRGDPVWDGYWQRLGDAAARAAGAVLLVAVENGTVLGTATVELDGDLEGEPLDPRQANFRMLAVDPPRRGRGVGRRLVQACLERARAEGRTRATLHTQAEMAAARSLYRAFGFEREPERDLVVAPGLELLAYGRELED